MTLLGIVSEVNEFAPKKALSSIKVTLFGIVSEVILLAPKKVSLNASLPIAVTPSGITTEPIQFEPEYITTSFPEIEKNPEVPQATSPLTPS